MRNATLLVIAIALSACATTNSDQWAGVSDEQLLNLMKEPTPLADCGCTPEEKEKGAEWMRWRVRTDAAATEYIRRHTPKPFPDNRSACGDGPGQLDPDHYNCGFLTPKNDSQGSAVDVIRQGH